MNGTVQTFGSDEDLLIRVPPQASTDPAAQAGLGDEIFRALAANYPGIVLQQANHVGPAVGDELA